MALASTFASLPADVLMELAISFLSDAEACRWSQCETFLLCILHDHPLKQPVPACRWKEKLHRDSEAQRKEYSFGTPSIISVDLTDKEDCHLLLSLDTYAPSAVVLELACPESACVNEAPTASLWRLPPLLTSLRTVPRAVPEELQSCIYDSEGDPCIFSVLLPATLTELHLEHWTGYISWTTANEEHPFRPRSLPAEVFPNLKDWMPYKDPEISKLQNLPDDLPRLEQWISEREEWTELPEGLRSLRLPLMECRSPPLHHLPPTLTHLENWNWDRHLPLDFPPSLHTIQELRRIVSHRPMRTIGECMPVFPHTVTALSYRGDTWRCTADMWNEGLLSLDLGFGMRGLWKEICEFPSSLQHISNLPLDRLLTLPPSLQSCTFKIIPQLYPLKGSELVFPSLVTSIRQLRQVQDLATLDLPPSLTLLQFHDSWASAIDALVLPSSLHTLHFGAISQHQSREEEEETHDTVGLFNHPLNLRAYPSITELHLGNRWNRPLTDLQLPSRLQKLTFGASFCQEIRAGDIKWPDALEQVHIPADFPAAIHAWSPPRNLKLLHVYTLPLSLEGMVPMLQLDTLYLQREARMNELSQVVPSLRRLSLQNPPSCEVEDFVLSATVEVFEIRAVLNEDQVHTLIQQFHVTESLKRLRVRVSEEGGDRNNIPHLLRDAMPHTVSVTVSFG